MLLAPIEDVELEDLQGIFGLKALRVEVNYNLSTKITLNDLMDVIKDESSN
ncbi:MAG: hypothetical protein JKY16_00400 [Lutibacter sp.]|nr:hypothetical protein [Lutibacter sp.]